MYLFILMNSFSYQNFKYFTQNITYNILTIFIITIELEFIEYLLSQ